MIIENLKTYLLNKTNNDEITLKIFNKLEKCIEYNIIDETNFFVTPNIWKLLPKKIENINIIMKGIERKIIYFVPDDYINFYNEYNFKVLKIKVNNKFKKYEHKDFLGSILGLNIKRTQIGDLIVDDNNICYVSVLKDLSEYLYENLKEIGKNDCSIEICNDFLYDSYNLKEMNIICSSKRLDSVVKGITGLSREKSQNIIFNKYVQVDYIVIEILDYIIKIDEIITIKGYGKYIVKNFQLTNKNKIKIILEKYV